MVSMNYGDLVEVVRATLDIPEVYVPALKARIKNLQSKSYPSGVNRKWERVKYGVREAFAISMVLKLSSGFVPPEESVRLIRMNWKEIAEAFSAAGADTASRSDRRADLLAVFPLRGLAPLGVGQGGPADAADRVRICRENGIEAALAKIDQLTAIINLGKLARSLRTNIAKVLEVAEAEVAPDFTGLAEP